MNEAKLRRIIREEVAGMLRGRRAARSLSALVGGPLDMAGKTVEELEREGWIFTGREKPDERDGHA